MGLFSKFSKHLKKYLFLRNLCQNIFITMLIVFQFVNLEIIHVYTINLMDQYNKHISNHQLESSYFMSNVLGPVDGRNLIRAQANEPN